jgi:hypothetical protein
MAKTRKPSIATKAKTITTVKKAFETVKADPVEEPKPDKVEEIKPTSTKVEEKQVDETIKTTRAVAFFNRSDTVLYEHNRDKHLVRYLGSERYWSLQQVEICLKDLTVTLVVDGTNPGAGRYLEFPRKTQIVIKSKEKRPCIGCGR